MARRRDDDEDDFTDQPPPRRRREDDDEDESPRPRRRSRRDDDEDEYRDVRRRIRSSEKLTGLDATFANTNIVVLILFGCLCSGIAFILGIVGLATCKDPTARQNALTVTIIGGIVAVVGTVARILQAIAAAAN